MAKVYCKGSVLGGKVEVLEFLSANGQGLAYKARDLASGKVVFLKQLNADPTTTGGSIAIKRFKREQSIKLDATHNVQVLYGLEHEGAFFLVSEFIDGEDLDDKLKNAGKPLSNEDTRDILHQSAEGLADAHGKGIVHRDVKPKNIMVDRKGTVKNVDWGLCRIMDEGTICDLRGPVGTILFMSPEHIKNDGVDRQSDLFGLGGVGYFCLTEFPPFDGADEEEIFRHILRAPPLPPKEINPAVDEDLNAIILKLLEKEKTARYLDAYELIRDLEMGFGGAKAVPRCKCGEPIAEGTRFCSRCGFSRHKPSTAYVGHLLILNGKNKGRKIDVPPDGGEFGRYELSPDDDFISRRHARMFFADGMFWVEDMGSLNGTSVNSLHIPRTGRHPLVPGDRVRFADTFCEFIH